jgi:peptidoglycan hydrolase-like protein with peptidoglycan-binding domain
VQRLQQALGIVPADGLFGPRSEAVVREFQRSKGLVPDGIVGPRSWAFIATPAP